MQFYMADIGMIFGFAGTAFAVWWALTQQRLAQLAPLLALAMALVSNYLFNGLAGSGLLEMAVRWLLAYLALRLTAEPAKRMTRGFPPTMRYATQQPTIEFEEVK